MKEAQTFTLPFHHPWEVDVIKLHEGQSMNRFTHSFSGAPYWNWGRHLKWRELQTMSVGGSILARDKLDRADKNMDYDWDWEDNRRQ